MILFGLGPGAQVIVLQALATYTGIGSAIFFARPVLRGQALQSQRELIASLKPKDPKNQGLTDLLQESSDALNDRARQKQPRDQRDNYWGFVLLLVSLVFFTFAVILQVSTDRAFEVQSG
jgi:hypothetical protein